MIFYLAYCFIGHPEYVSSIPKNVMSDVNTSGLVMANDYHFLQGFWRINYSNDCFYFILKVKKNLNKDTNLRNYDHKPIKHNPDIKYK